MLGIETMKTLIVGLLVLLSFGEVRGQSAPVAKPATKSGVSVSAAPAGQVSREKAWEYLTLTQRAAAMEKTYKARFIDVKGAKPVSDELKKKHLNELNNMLIKLVQKSFSAASLDAVLAFLRTPAGERWAEDASTFNEEFRDESSELLNQFSEEIKEASEDAAEAAADAAPAKSTAPAKPGR